MSSRRNSALLTTSWGCWPRIASAMRSVDLCVEQFYLAGLKFGELLDQMLLIRRRHSGILPNVFAVRQRAAVAAKVLVNVAAVAEIVHDVRELIGMLQPQRVTRFMQAREINNRVPHQIVFDPLGRIHDINLRTVMTFHIDRHRLSV